ncbi:MAG: DNA translocase FtsK 4TM domain-containing protein, partial [Thermomicrobiales bacterium]|nr:DNA translocase FtsK 4TM domain-containing protein [Thermomicrobiales bacterium]
MATTARRRGSSAAQRGTSLPAGAAQRLLAIWRGFRTSPPDLVGTPRFRRELVGVVLVLLAMLSAYVIGRGGDEGRFVAWWGENLQRSFGKGALLVPMLLALASLRAFGGQSGRILEARHYLGGFAFAVAVAGLLHLGDRSLAAAPGGALGMSVATLSHRILGPFGAGLVLFAIGVMGIFLLAGSDLQTFSNDVRDLGSVIWTGIVLATAALAAVVRNFASAVRQYEQKPTTADPAPGQQPAPQTPVSGGVVVRNTKTLNKPETPAPGEKPGKAAV